MITSMADILIVKQRSVAKVFNTSFRGFRWIILNMEHDGTIPVTINIDAVDELTVELVNSGLQVEVR